MKIWIIHDSVYGNGEKLAKTLGAAFEKKAEVNIAHNKKVTPEKVASDSPDVLIIGTAARKFKISGGSKKWLRKLNAILRKEKKTIKYGASFLTHVLPDNVAKFWGTRFHKLYQKLPVTKVYPEWISGRVEKPEGPFAAGEQEKFEKIGKELADWAK
ncbi:MAG: hypothetical protein ACFFDW_07630 [Candidatus Thorarchaeota archaeon]